MRFLHHLSPPCSLSEASQPSGRAILIIIVLLKASMPLNWQYIIVLLNKISLSNGKFTQCKSGFEAICKADKVGEGWGWNMRLAWGVAYPTGL